MRTTARAAGVLATLPFLLLVGCAAPAEDDDASEEPTSEPRTLRLGNVTAHNGQPMADVAAFIEQVSAVSNGALEIEFVWTQAPDSDLATETPEVERALVTAVAEGNLDLGITGARVFATLGVESMEFLNAPMLIDSYALQRAVLESDITDGVLDDLDEAGVAGLGLLPGVLRRPMSATKPLTTPKAWEGVRIHVFDSVLGAEAVAALGATPVIAGPEDRDQGLADGSIQAVENTLSFHTGIQRSTPYVPLNLVLWPNPAALVANPDVADSLSEQEIDWLSEAAAGVAAISPDDLDPGAAAANLEHNCSVGARYAVATKKQLAAMEAAFEPVYADLARDAETRDRMDQVRDLKETVEAEAAPEVPTDCADDGAKPDPKGDDPGALSGTFESRVWRVKALVEAGVEEVDAQAIAAEPFSFLFDFAEGRFVMSWKPVDGETAQICSGTYHVEGDQVTVELTESGGCGITGFFFDATVETTGQGVRFTELTSAHPTDALIFGDPTGWTRIE